MIIAKYKYNSTLYSDLLPIFNPEFIGYSVTDVTEEGTDSEGNAIQVVTRTIEHDSLKPTFIQFGQTWVDSATDAANRNRCKSLLEVLELDTSDIVNMNSMFRLNHNLTQLDVSNFNTSNVTNMYCAFASCLSLTHLDVSKWDTSKVVNMTNMFHTCSSLTHLDVSKWDTSKVGGMSYMFAYCSRLTQLDVSNWNTSNVTNMSNMFYECSSLTQLDLSNFDTFNVTDMSNMFQNCSSLTRLDLSKFDTSKVTRMDNIFCNCNLLISIGDVSDWNTSKVTRMDNMFNKCYPLAYIDVSNWNTSKVTRMDYMFYYCSSLTQLDVSNWNTSNVTDMLAMFAGCSSLTQLDVSNFNTSKVTNMRAMFRQCTSLTHLDLSNFNVTNVTSMSNMFQNCSSLTHLDLSNFNVTNVIDIDNLFYGSILLSHIGALYCSPHTIYRLSNQLTSDTPNTSNITIWVLDTYPDEFYNLPNNVTIEKYIGETRYIPLTSPLLQGDRLEVIDNKLYHYHKMGKVVLDGSCTYSMYGNVTEYEYVKLRVRNIDTDTYNIKNNASIISDRFILDSVKAAAASAYYDNYYIGYNSEYSAFYLSLKQSLLDDYSVESFVKYFTNNPATIIYELANPYYELISEDINLIFNTDLQVAVENHSIVPTNQVNFLSYREEIDELKINTTYRVSFSADTKGKDLIISLGGIPKTIVSDVENTVVITTGGTLIDNYLSIEGFGHVHIDNVRVTEGEWVEPYFSGLQSSFETELVDGEYLVEIENVYSPIIFNKGGRE